MDSEDKMNISKKLSDPARLLVVDDESGIVEILCEIFSANGYETVGCTSGKEALEILMEQSFDLILTDLRMPEMDGLELLKAVKKTEQNLVVIIMTADAEKHTVLEAEKAGARAFIFKPLNSQELLTMISHAVESKRYKHY
jgi:DNA-binding NtrC family response regulator